jgi:hypothetical protein
MVNLLKASLTYVGDRGEGGGGHFFYRDMNHVH